MEKIKQNIDGHIEGYIIKKNDESSEDETDPDQNRGLNEKLIKTKYNNHANMNWMKNFNCKKTSQREEKVIL